MGRPPTVSGRTIAGIPRHETSSASTVNPPAAHQLHGRAIARIRQRSHATAAGACPTRSEQSNSRGHVRRTATDRPGAVRGRSRATHVQDRRRCTARASRRRCPRTRRRTEKRSAGTSRIRAAQPWRSRASRGLRRIEGSGSVDEFAHRVGIVCDVQPVPAPISTTRPWASASNTPAGAACPRSRPMNKRVGTATP